MSNVAGKIRANRVASVAEWLGANPCEFFSLGNLPLHFHPPPHRHSPSPSSSSPSPLVGAQRAPRKPSAFQLRQEAQLQAEAALEALKREHEEVIAAGGEVRAVRVCCRPS